MNCLWLLILLCCSRNNCECTMERENKKTFHNRSVAHDCNSCFDNVRERCCENDYERHTNNECDRCHEADNDTMFERRNFVPFKNQTCGCENNQCQ